MSSVGLTNNAPTHRERSGVIRYRGWVAVLTLLLFPALWFRPLSADEVTGEKDQRRLPAIAPRLPSRLPTARLSTSNPPERLTPVKSPQRLAAVKSTMRLPPPKSTMRLPGVAATPASDASGLDEPAAADVDHEAVIRPSDIALTPTSEIVQGIDQPQLRYPQSEPLELHEAIQLALMNAPEITLLRSDVGIARAEVDRQDAAFDWAMFVNSTWDDRNSPVGNTLDGATDRLLNRGFDNQAGLRQKNQVGGSIEVGQLGNFANSNSEFFVPRGQAVAQLGVVYEQPLLQGGGREVARSRFELAVAESLATQESFLAGLQAHILNTINAYWDLASNRATCAIERRNFDRAEKVAQLVNKRTELDVGPAQVARVEATLALRKTELLRTEYAVLLAQERLMRLMLGPKFDQQTAKELVPTTNFLAKAVTAEVELQQQVALQNRPEIRRSIQQIKQAAIEQGVAKNQLLPILGLTLSMSNRGLAGNRRFGSAFDDQFDLANATYGVGLAYELPIGNRAARANLTQSRLRVARLQAQFEATVADVTLEVRNAAHLLALSIQELELSTQEKLLAQRELTVIETRYLLLVDGDAVGLIYLDNLLQTQDRLAGAELRLVQAGLQCKRAEFELQRATGLLLRETKDEL